MQHAIHRSTNSSTHPHVRDEMFTEVDERRKAYAESLIDKWHCTREILYAEYLWDMRTWHKPKFEYTREEIQEHIRQWMRDHHDDKWTNNCGHCLYCIHKLLYMRWATWDEVIDLIEKNNNITYPDEIGTWTTVFKDYI